MQAQRVMSPAPSTPAPTFQHRLLIFTVLTILFTLLHYMGSAIYVLAGGLTSVKPYSGVALALILIMGERWLVPVLVAGTLGGMLAKLAGAAPLYDLVITPCVTSLTLLVIYLARRRLIAKQPRLPRLASAGRRIVHGDLSQLRLHATTFHLAIDGINRPHLGTYWQAQFIPTALSYVIFSPVIVLLATAERRVLAGTWRRLCACVVLMSLMLAANFLPVRLPLLFITPMALLIVTLGLEARRRAALGPDADPKLVLTSAIAMGYSGIGHRLSAAGSISLYFTPKNLHGGSDRGDAAGRRRHRRTHQAARQHGKSVGARGPGQYRPALQRTARPRHGT